MKIELTSTELVLSILAFLGVVALIISLYVVYKFIKLYKRVWIRIKKTIENLKEK